MLRRMAAAVGVVLVSGCGPTVDNVSPIEPEVQQVVAQLDAKQFGAMYDGGTAGLQSESRAAFIADLQKLDAQMGQCQAPVRTDTMGPHPTMGAESEQVVFSRTCTSGVWVVTIIVMGVNGKGQLNAYSIEPAADAT